MIRVIETTQTTELADALKRPSEMDYKQLETVKEIVTTIKNQGEIALRDYSVKFDKLNPDMSFLIPAETIKKAKNSVSQDLKTAIQLARNTIQKFHENQRIGEQIISTSPGVFCWRKELPIERVGLYIPGGTAPLFSSLLMLAVPALIAGAKEIVVCSPPDANGFINDKIAYVANVLGLKQLYRIGGAQAIAAMAYGTESVPKVDKIFGPGNSYVTLAKRMVQEDGVAIDLPAGPSELAIIADDTANPEFVAADLLSQAEHGIDSQVLLLSNSRELVQEVIKSLKHFTDQLPRKSMIQSSLSNSVVYINESLEALFEVANTYAPEHLSLQMNSALQYIDKIRNAGSVFIGHYSAESFADYCSGTNHTLPTNGFAKAYSGVSLQSFMKCISFQEIHEQGVRELAPATMTMAREETLEAHELAAKLRLKSLQHPRTAKTVSNKIASIH